MTCFIKMNSRTGEIRATKQKKTDEFPAERMEKMKETFEAFKKEALKFLARIIDGSDVNMVGKSPRIVKGMSQ